MSATAKVDPIERAKQNVGEMYPGAVVRTRSVNGRPVILALEGNLIRLVRYKNLDAKQPRHGKAG